MKNVIENLSDLSHNFFGSYPNKIIKLKGDGSYRNVYRIYYSHASYIGIYGPNISENRAFLSFTKQFMNQNLPVPFLYTCSPDYKFYLEEDLGDLLLNDYVAQVPLAQHVTNIYQKVINILPQFQIDAGRSFDYSQCYQSKFFDYEAMMRDLLYFKDNFLSAFCRISYNENSLLADFKKLASLLAKADAEHFLYRDFQSKNIMIVVDQPHFIDYQSGRVGALQYDVASLLFDSNVDLDDEFRNSMLFYYLENLGRYSDITIDVERFLALYYEFALLRVLQALAAFAFLSLQKKKTQFLKSIPQGLNNISSLLQNKELDLKLPELRRIFETDILQNEKLLNL
jgi:aminoglycoside/choline kinase family phosphotransferase